MNPTVWHDLARIGMQERMTKASSRRHRRSRRRGTRGPRVPLSSLGIGLGLATIYGVWGSTYLAIRVAVETIPPLLLISVRFLVAGALLYGWVRLRGLAEPTGPSEWRAAALLGATMILGGNAGVAWAEQYVPSGMVALLVATIPLFMAGVGRLAYREPLDRRAGVGLILGVAGAAGLIGLPEISGAHPVARFVPLGAALAWSVGSLYSRRAPRPRPPLQGVAMQMLAGGALTGSAALLGGEAGRMDPAGVSAGSLAALAYLVVFGSLLAFPVYLWLLRTVRTSVVSTYAFVNPLVAVLLGWAVLREPVTGATLLSGGVIVAGVGTMLLTRARPTGLGAVLGRPPEQPPLPSGPAPPGSAGIPARAA